MSNKGNVDIGIGVNLMDVTQGQTLRLKDGRIGTVTENMGDGQWVEMRFQDDDVELIHSQEIDAII
jgi:phosphoribosylformimino-5-aminoimidazole carboxamide ribonucleotide (ProFAR) isomerase